MPVTVTTFTWANVQDALYDAVAAALPTCKVVWAISASPAAMPAKPFAVLNITTRDIAPGQPGRDEVQLTSDAAGVVKHAFHRRHTLSVNVYSNSTAGDTHAAALLSNLTHELQTDTRRAALKAAGCKAWQNGIVSDLSTMLDTRGESRAQCDLTVATLYGTTETTGWIETASLSGIEVDGEPV